MSELTLHRMDVLDEARELLAQRLTEPAAAPPLDPGIPDPLERPIVDPSIGMRSVPEYTAAEIVELLTLLHPLRMYRRGEWVIVDQPNMLEHLRTSRRLWLDEQQDKADARWQSTGAYQRAHAAAMAEQLEAAEDRKHDRARAERLDALAAKRELELIEYGLPQWQAAAQVKKEFPDV